MKNFTVFILSGVLLAFPIVFAQQESDGDVGGAATDAIFDIVGAVVDIVAVAPDVASSKSDACHTC